MRIVAGMIDQLSRYVMMKAYAVKRNITLQIKNGKNFKIIAMLKILLDEMLIGMTFISISVFKMERIENAIEAKGIDGKHAALPRES